MDRLTDEADREGQTTRKTTTPGGPNSEEFEADVAELGPNVGRCLAKLFDTGPMLVKIGGLRP